MRPLPDRVLPAAVPSGVSPGLLPTRLPERPLPADELPSLIARFSMPPILDRAEFGRLFEEHARLLWVVAASRVPRAVAQDVVQEAAMIALQRLDRFTPGTDFRAWMAQVVRWTAANTMRQLRRSRPADDTTLDVQAPAGETVVASPVVDANGRLLADQTAFDDALIEALDQLHEDARAALLLRVVLDLPYADIAATLGVPEGTVASHVHRAREVLRRRLAPNSADQIARRAQA